MTQGLLLYTLFESKSSYLRKF